jgi:hypothetical protein
MGLGYILYELCELSISARRFVCLSEDVYITSRNVCEPVHSCWCTVKCCLLMRLLNSRLWSLQVARLHLSVKVGQRFLSCSNAVILWALYPFEEVKVKVKFTIEQAMKAQRRNRCIGLLLL